MSYKWLTTVMQSWVPLSPAHQPPLLGWPKNFMTPLVPMTTPVSKRRIVNSRHRSQPQLIRHLRRLDKQQSNGMWRTESSETKSSPSDVPFTAEQQLVEATPSPDPESADGHTELVKEVNTKLDEIIQLSKSSLDHQVELRKQVQAIRRRLTSGEFLILRRSTPRTKNSTIVRGK